MSFFTTSTGEKLAGTVTTDFVSGSADFEIFPKGTRLLAVIEEAKIKNFEGEDYINLKWSVAAPAEHKNRKVFQKVKVWQADPAKRDTQIRMLAAIDANCGGKLMATGKEPDDFSLQCLTNHPMVIELDVWDMNGKQGNWVRAVSARKTNGQAAQAPTVTKPAPTVATSATVAEEDIPF